MKTINNQLRNFSTYAFNVITEEIINKLELFGISPDKLFEAKTDLLDIDESLLRNLIDDCYSSENFNYIVKKIANTWFSRLIILKILDVNEIDHSYKNLENISLNLNELNNLLKNLNYLSPELFNLKDYSNLFFPINTCLINELDKLPEELFNLDNFDETISIFYEYFNSNFRNLVYKELKSKTKIKDSTLPIVTQFFTPNYIVKYLVQNSVGRLWINHLLVTNPNLKEEDLINEFRWEYYIPTNFKIQNYSSETVDYFKFLKLEELTILDPALGSGSIISYCFDLLLELYQYEGYKNKEAVSLILEKNLYGLEIDSEVIRLNEIILRLKSFKYDPNFLSKKINFNFYCFKNFNSSNFQNLKYFGNSFNDELKNKLNEELRELCKIFKDAQLLGSLLKIRNYNFSLLEGYINDINLNKLSNLKRYNLKNFQLELFKIINIAKILNEKFNIVITNPPYLSNRNYNSTLKNYLRENYKRNFRDLYTAFIERCLDLTTDFSYCSLITMNSWLFLKYNKPLREKIINYSIINMVHLGTNAFNLINGEVVQTVAFVIQKEKLNNFEGSYLRLTDTDNKNEGIKNKNNLILANQDNFKSIPNIPFAYWINDKMANHFKEDIKLSNIAEAKQGLATTDNKRFLRQWTELDFNEIQFNISSTEEAQISQGKWFPYNKGGSFRKWYGNDQYCVNYFNDGIEIKENTLKKYSYLKSPDFVVKNTNYYFKPAITWSLISPSKPSFRIKDYGYIFDVAGMSLFTEENKYYLLGLLNSVIVEKFLEIIAPTINYQCGDIAQIPIIIDKNKQEEIEKLVEDNIKLSKIDWDNFEFSWNFKTHPLIKQTKTIKEAFELFKINSQKNFEQLKRNEEELNKLFLKIYGLDNEYSYDIKDRFITIRKADLQREIKSFLSYFVGILFGRYSLDYEGLILTNENLESDNYKIFKPLETNFISLEKTISEPNIIDYLERFLSVVYGSDSLEENIEFIAKALNPRSSNEAREIIRRYFKTSFYRDHLKIYNRKPIYLQISLKDYNGFSGLIYYHRFNETGYDPVIKFLTNEITGLNTSLNKYGLSRQEKQLIEKDKTRIQHYKEIIQILESLEIKKIDFDNGITNNLELLQTNKNGNVLRIFK